MVVEEHPYRDTKKVGDGRHRQFPNKHKQNFKLLYQIEGKKRMRQFGKVDIPQAAFIAALKVDV